MPLYTSEVSVDNTPLPVSVSSALPAGTNVIGHVITDSGSTTSISNATLAVTQSGTWTVSLATESIEIGKVDQGTPGTLANAWPVELSDGTNLIGVSAHPLFNNMSQVGGSAIALGNTTMSASLPVTIASNQTALPVTLTSTTITGTVAVTQSTSPWVVSLASTTITGTTTVAGNLTHNNAAPAATNIGVLPAVASTAAPTYTTGDQVLLSTDLSGNLRVTLSASAAEQNVNLNQVGGAAIALGQTTMAASLPVTLASNQSALPVTLTSTTITGTVAVTQSTSPWVVSGTVTSNIGTTNGLALDATVAKLTLAQGSTTAAQTGPLVQAAVTTAAPTYTTATSNPLSMLTTGALRTDNTSWLGSTAPTVGSKTSANSIPVVIASDQAAIPVTSTPTTVSTATVTSVSVSTTVATLLSSRAARISAVIFNESGTLFVKAGSAASSTDYTWRMTANTELDISGYTGIVTATKSAGTSNAQVTDF